MLIASFLIVSTLIGSEPSQATAPREDEAATSVDRVRKALDRPPPRLVVTRREPDFKVHIIEGSPLDAIERDRFLRSMSPIFDFTPASQPAGVTSPFGSQPLFVVDLLSPLRNAISSMLRARAQAAARADVVRAISEYCAAQPDNGADIQICSLAPPVR